VEDQVPASLELLRQEARDELSALIEFRCRQGDDPWDFIPAMPSVDEQVVAALRTEAVAVRGLSEARSRAHHPTASAQTRAAFEYDILRGIALEHPSLTQAVWTLLDQLPAH
jgi:hypothetical protein